MDIRDIMIADLEVISEEVNDLEALLALQKELVNRYVEIEKFPMYPWVLSYKEHQVHLKDFIARITEELGEAYESLLVMPANIGVLAYMVNNMNFFEELADALHFMLEVIIVAGIPIPPTILDTVKYHLNSNPAGESTGLTAEQAEELFKGNTSNPLKRQYIGLEKIGNLVESFPAMAWEVTFYLQMARNSLKNKPWKQTSMLTDTEIFSNNLVMALGALLKLFICTGLGREGILNIYQAKNKINLFRIRSKY